MTSIKFVTLKERKDLCQEKILVGREKLRDEKTQKEHECCRYEEIGEGEQKWWENFKK